MRRILISTFAIVCALSSWAAATFAGFAYGLKATQDGDNATFTFSVTDPVQNARIILTSTKDGSTIAIPIGVINTAGEHSINYDMSGLTDEYTWSVEVTPEAISSSSPALNVKDGRTSAYRGGVVCITDPQSDAFGYTVIGMGMGKGFTVYDPAGNKVSTTIPASTVCNASHSKSPYRGGELDGMAVFADYSDAYSAYHVFDPLNPSTTPDNLLAADGFQRYTTAATLPSGCTEGIWATADHSVITGGNASCAAFYKDTEGTHLITLGEDIDPANSIVRYTLDANGKISSAPDKKYTNATALLASTKDCDIIAIENGFFVCNNTPSVNTDANPAFFYCDYDGTVQAKSSGIAGLSGTYSGIAINSSRDMLAIIGTLSGANKLIIYKITWTGNVPSFTQVNALGLPTATKTISWASLRYDPAGNLWAYLDHYGYRKYAIQNYDPQAVTTPAKTDNTVSGTGVSATDLRALAYDLSYDADNDSHSYFFTYSLSADAKSVVFKFTDPDDGSIKHEIQMDDLHTFKGDHIVELDLNQLAKGKDYLWTVEVEAYPSGEYTELASFDRTSTRGSVIPVTEPNSMWFGYTLTASGNNGGFIFYDAALEVASTATSERFNSATAGSPYRGTFHNGYAYVANNDVKTSGIYKVDILNIDNPNLLFSGARASDTGVFTFEDATTGSGRVSCVAFQGSGVGTKLYTFDVIDAKINRYDIGEAEQITTAPTVITLTGVSLANLNCDIITTDNGYFVSQSRASEGHSTSVPCFVYCDNANNVLYNSGNHKDIIPSCSSGIALNAQEDRFAVCRRDVGIIDVFQVTWTAGTPALTKLGEISTPISTWSQLRFDAAGNLHAYHANASNSYYKVYSIAYPAATTTTCCPTKIAGGVSGVDIIQVGPAVDETPRFFNLQGVEVSADNLTPGIYIRVCNGTSTKVQVK